MEAWSQRTPEIRQLLSDLSGMKLGTTLVISFINIQVSGIAYFLHTQFQLFNHRCPRGKVITERSKVQSTTEYDCEVSQCNDRELRAGVHIHIRSLPQLSTNSLIPMQVWLFVPTENDKILEHQTLNTLVYIRPQRSLSSMLSSPRSGDGKSSRGGLFACRFATYGWFL